MNLSGLRIGACFGKAALKTHALQTLRDCRTSRNRAKRLQCVRFIDAFRPAQDGQWLMVPMHAKNERSFAMNVPSFTKASPLTRRQFLKSSGLAVVAGTLAPPKAVAQSAVSPGQTLRVGLIGCGGRGTGAAAQALAADPNVKLMALGDAFRDRLEGSLATLKKQHAVAEKIDVPQERCFVGFGAYRNVIEHSDVVLLATPPHFRPIHLQAAIAAGKHVFAEKPVAVDAPGVRKVLAACEEARKKNLSIVSGLAMRYSLGHREIIKRLHEGAVGQIRALQANDFRGPIWVKPRQPGWTDMEYHMRNWYYFTWLSGDFNVEQHIHLLDLCSWIMNEYPARAYGTGGRQVRTAPEYGNIYDHHAVVYESANAGNYGANGDLHRSADHLGTSPELSGRFVAGQI